MSDERYLETNAMRMRAIFERKIGLNPKDLTKVSKNLSIDDILLEKIRTDLEGNCSQHGWVIPGTVRILSRSMCQNEAGRFTGSMVSWVQAEGDVYYPTDYMRVSGEVLKKNKMGMFVVYENAVQIIVPRDLHLGDEAYDAVEIGQYVEVELKKSRFQVSDKYISSVGVFKKVVEKPVSAAAAVTATPPPKAVTAASAAAAAAAPPAEVVEEEGVEEEQQEAVPAAVAAVAAVNAPVVARQGPAAAPAAAAAVAPAPAAAAAAIPDAEPELGGTIGDFM